MKKRLLHLLGVLLMVVVATSLLRPRPKEERPDPRGRISVENIYWKATIQEEAETFAALDIVREEDSDGEQVWKNSEGVRVRASANGQIKTVFGLSLYLDGKPVLKRGMGVDKVPEELKQAFTTTAWTPQGIPYGMAENAEGERYIIYAWVPSGQKEFWSFQFGAAPTRETGIELGHPPSLYD